MSISTNNGKERNLPIPEEAIERAAGMNDVIELNGYWVKSACKEKDENPTKKNTETIIESPKQRQGKYDIGLAEGMVIPAKDGGIAITLQENTDRDDR
ncbi:MAG: hypothetical protein HFJ35_03690 [Clostridia bacterium]|nr:hypothetical protein [Clostridia bacterium]